MAAQGDAALHESRYANEDWTGRRFYVEERPRGPSWLGIACLAAVGVAVVATIWMAPDIQRYIKIRNM
jgi:hypothetical protein